jgi:hypothetical protein
MKRAIFCVLLPFLLIVGIMAQNSHGADRLQCVDSAEPNSARETAQLHQSPHGAKRLSRHQLEVAWTGGKAIFKDTPPYNEPLDGLRWVYCGYSPTLKLHLIGKRDGDLFTGTLLDDRTGLRLPGGDPVLFSPDRQYYLAYEQPDGLDGEALTLYKRTGTVVWKGYNGILSRDGKSVVVNSEDMCDMRWDSENRPQATVHLDGGKKLIVTLTQTSNGKREWLPHVQK